MSAPGSLSVSRTNQETITYVSRWQIGAAGAHSKDYGRGIQSISRTAAGKYTINFFDVPEGPLVGVRITHWSQAAAAPLLASPVDGTYSVTSKTVQYNTWLSSTLAATEIPSGDQVTIECTWLKTA